VPALASLLFYAGYIPHRRYFLASLWFALPFAGYGLYLCLEAIDRILGSRCRLPKSLGPAAATACFLVLGIRHLDGLAPWGPEVRWGDARAFQQAIASFADPGDYVFVDPRCRYFTDAISSLTDLRLGGAVGPLDREGTHALYYASPLDRACYLREWKRVIRPMASLEKGMVHHARLEPVTGPPDGLPDVSVGTGAFRIYRLRAWTNYCVRAAVALEPGEDRTVWVDLRAADPGPVKHARLLAADGRTLLKWSTAPGNGLCAYFIPGSLPVPPSCHIEISSTTPLPDSASAMVQAGPDPLWISLGRDRSRSSHSWLRPVPGRRRSWAEDVAVLARDMAFHLPIPQGLGTGWMEVSLRIEAARGSSGALVLTCCQEGERLVKHVGDVRSPISVHAIRFRPSSTRQGEIVLNVALQEADGPREGFRVKGIGFRAGSD
jgi:hypothetical protein